MRILIEGKIEGIESCNFSCSRCQTRWVVPFEELHTMVDDNRVLFSRSSCPLCDKESFVRYDNWSAALQTRYDRELKEAYLVQEKRSIKVLLAFFLIFFVYGGAVYFDLLG